MRTREDIEAYLLKGGQPYEEVAAGTWIIHDQGNADIVVRLEDELVIFRCKVLDLTDVKRREPLYAKLLELNAAVMLEGAWGVADNAVVLTAARRLENLDFNEFEGVIDDFSLGITNHNETLSSFRDK